MIQISSEWSYDDYRAAQDAEEGARQHDAQQSDEAEPQTDVF